MDSYVGPFTSLADGVQVLGSEIEHSIMLQHSRLESVRGRVADSLFGVGAVVRSTATTPVGEPLHGGRQLRGRDSEVGRVSETFRKVLVGGGAGFIGSHFARLMLRRARRAASSCTTS